MLQSMVTPLPQSFINAYPSCLVGIVPELEVPGVAEYGDPIVLHQLQQVFVVPLPLVDHCPARGWRGRGHKSKPNNSAGVYLRRPFLHKPSGRTK